MVVKRLLNITILFALCPMFCRATKPKCSQAKSSIYGMMLRQHVIRKITGISQGGLCLLECYRDVRCQSYNFLISRATCELNNRTKEARPEDFVPDYGRYYFTRNINRGKFNLYNKTGTKRTELGLLNIGQLHCLSFCVPVPLGSIPELPAETCKEIKASEGGQAVSGKYWFDSITPGQPVLAPCDMDTEGN